MTRARLAALLLGCLATAGVAAAAPAPPGRGAPATPTGPGPALAIAWVGEWDGAIVAVAAEMEVDTSIEIGTDAAGGLRGELWFPTQGPKRYPLKNLLDDGTSLSFLVEDAQGVKTFFNGKLSADRGELAGTMSENEQRAPFALRRCRPAQQAPAPAPPVLDLGADGAALRNAFDSQVGHRRLVLMLSPTLFSSRMDLRLVERYVLAADPDPDLVVFVVWEPLHRSDDEASARRAANLVDDPRVVYFWSPTRFASTAWKPAFSLLGAAGEVADPVLVFARDCRWQGSVPLPDRLFQTWQGGAPVPAERRFNALAVAHALAAGPPPAPAGR